MDRHQRQLTLNKGNQKFVFRYDLGCESELIDAMIDQAGDTRTEFDFFDAAVLSFKLTQSLVSQADKLLKADDNLEIESGNLQL